AHAGPGQRRHRQHRRAAGAGPGDQGRGPRHVRRLARPRTRPRRRHPLEQVTITVVVSLVGVSAVDMDIKPGVGEVGRGTTWGAGRAALGPPGRGAQAAPEGLPGPRPGCPPQPGVVAPAAMPWAQQELGFAAVWKRTRGGGVTVAVVDSGVDANPQFGDRVIPGPDLVAGTKPGIPPGADC